MFGERLLACAWLAWWIDEVDSSIHVYDYEWRIDGEQWKQYRIVEDRRYSIVSSGSKWTEVMAGDEKLTRERI